MKETVLTNAELGEYAYNGTYDTMSYYWDDNCHPAAYGYSTSSDSSANCANTNSYATSKVKEMLEGTYINTLGSNKLKEVDGYKIRLITLEELQQNLGISTTMVATWYDVDAINTPTWVYQNFGDQSNNVYTYWTMTSSPDSSFRLWCVILDGHGSSGNVIGSSVYNNYGVRPVINLLKSAIE